MHFPIFSTLTISPLPSSPLSDFSFRCLKSINISMFTRDILSSRLILILLLIYVILLTLTIQRFLHFPLGTLISDSSVNHHLYADDTQLFISFSAPDFSQNLSHLETTIDTVSTWMSANLLSFNQSQSKTEFLLIGLPKQLSKLSL